MLRKNGLSVGIILMFIGLMNGYAQETVPSSGGNASGSGGSVSYTVGQVVYKTNSGTSGSVAQGVQQPYEISVETGNQEIKGITLSCSAYPNPVTDFIILDVDNAENKKLSYLLYDLNGKMLDSKEIHENKTSVNMGIYVAGTYFMKITELQHTSLQEIKIFKIIKN
jgi:hypothetical protein